MSDKKFNNEKKINIEQVVQYLSRAFFNAQDAVKDKIGSNNSKGTILYQYQVDFCYLIDSIQRDSVYVAVNSIREANELIANLEKEPIK